MKHLSLIALTSVSFGFLCTPTCFGQTADSAVSNLTADSIRAKYDHSALLPTGISFTSTLRTTMQIHREAPEFAEEMVAKGMGLDSKGAREFLDQLLVALAKYEESANALGKEIACDATAPRAVGEAAYKLIENIEDAHEVLALDHYHAFIRGLDAETAARFAQWVEQRKLNIVYVKIDHAAFARANGLTGIDARMAGLCK